MRIAEQSPECERLGRLITAYGSGSYAQIAELAHELPNGQ
jgi:hypothetical protein